MRFVARRLIEIHTAKRRFERRRESAKLRFKQWQHDLNSVRDEIDKEFANSTGTSKRRGRSVGDDGSYSYRSLYPDAPHDVQPGRGSLSPQRQPTNAQPASQKHWYAARASALAAMGLAAAAVASNNGAVPQEAPEGGRVAPPMPPSSTTGFAGPRPSLELVPEMGETIDGPLAFRSLKEKRTGIAGKHTILVTPRKDGVDITYEPALRGDEVDIHAAIGDTRFGGDSMAGDLEVSDRDGNGRPEYTLHATLDKPFPPGWETQLQIRAGNTSRILKATGTVGRTRDGSSTIRGDLGR